MVTFMEWSVRIDGHSVLSQTCVQQTCRSTRRAQPPLSASAVPLSEQGFQPNVFEMDGFGIVYLIENAQQFWSGVLCCVVAVHSSALPLLTLISELEDILKIPENAPLSLLDATLKRSMTFCASYHGA